MIWPTISVAILGAVTTMFTLFLQVDLLTQGDAPTIAYMINSKIQGDPNSRSEAAAIGLTFTVIATPIILVVKKLLDKVSDNFGF
jgi:ABC-type sugar transport system permease subunit